MPRRSKKRSRFGANIKNDVTRQSQSSRGPSYLKLPKGVSLFKEKKGRVKFDIIPYIVAQKGHMDCVVDDPDSAHVGNPWYKKPILVHNGIGADRKGYVCPKSVGKKKCPICEERQKMFQEGAEADDVPGRIQKRNIYRICVKGHKDYEDDEILVWNTSQGNFQEVLNKELEEPTNDKYVSFPDPEEGFLLNTRFSEETFNKSKYYEASRIDFEERGRRGQYDESIMEEGPNLDEIVEVLSYKELELLFLELDEDDVADEEEDDEDEDEAPKSRSTRRSKKHVDEDEEDEDEEDEDEDWDEEEEDDEDDDEDEDEDEDEEDDEDDEEDEEEDDDEDEDDEDDEEDEVPRRRTRTSKPKPKPRSKKPTGKKRTSTRRRR